jgi:hypothetical protein
MTHIRIGLWRRIATGALVAAALILSACAPDTPRQAKVVRQAKKTHPVRIVHKQQPEEPVFRVKGAPERFVVFDPSQDSWLWLTLNNGHYQVDSRTVTPPAYEPRPAAAIPDTALSQVSAATPASAQPIEADAVSENEISTWEGEGGNLGPVEVAAPAEVGEAAPESSPAAAADSGGADAGGDSGGGGGD